MKAIVIIVIIQLHRFLSRVTSSFPSSTSTHLTNLHHIRIITKLQDPQAALDKSDALLVHLGRQE